MQSVGPLSWPKERLIFYHTYLEVRYTFNRTCIYIFFYDVIGPLDNPKEKTFQFQEFHLNPANPGHPKMCNKLLPLLFHLWVQAPP